LWQRGHEKEGPLVTVKTGVFSLHWLPLLHGHLHGEGVIDGADVMMVKNGPAEKPKESKEEKQEQKQEKLAEVRRWQTELAEAFPMELTRFEIRNSRVRFVDQSVQPPPELAINGLHLVLTGLGNENQGEDLPASARLEGTLTGNGKLNVAIQANPTAKQPRFTCRMEVRELDLTALNNFTHAYASADVMKGIFEVFLEVEAANGHYQGYVKPFIRDLEFKAVPDPNQGPIKRLATSAASAVTSLLKNDEQKVATRAPFEGDFAQNDVNIWVTIENLLRNAFVQSLREGLEGRRPVR
jgi:hypothetical protein